MQASRGMMRGFSAAPAPCRPCCVPSLRPARGALLVVGAAGPKPIEKLKRAPSAYNLYYRSKYPEVSSALAAKTGTKPGLAECAQAIFSLWKSLPANQKAPFEQEAGVIKQQLDAARAAGTIIQPKAKKPKRVGPPRPPSVYAAFTKAEFPAFKAAHPTATVGEISKMIGAKWTALPDAQKNALKAKAAQELEAFKAAHPPAAAAAPVAAAPAKPKAKTSGTPAPVAKPTPAKTGTTPAPTTKRTTPAASVTPTKAATPTRGASVTRKSPPMK